METYFFSKINICEMNVQSSLLHLRIELELMFKNYIISILFVHLFINLTLEDFISILHIKYSLC